MVGCEYTTIDRKFRKLSMNPAISTMGGTENGYRLTSWDQRCESVICVRNCFLTGSSGNTTVDIEHRLCVIDNVNNGFDIYKIDSRNFVRTLITRDPIKTYPKGVAFANHSQAIVGGSDHGLVYIFERKSGRVITTLRHGKAEGVQTVTVSDLVTPNQYAYLLQRCMTTMKQ